ncbi:MAG TPA: pyridoxal-5'-phosphate-dependent protein [Oceanospirillaceae bacterium]|nr:pyridoxal-5'-phosphate-dependent protein [Oceanospirillaceae bacterium]
MVSYAQVLQAQQRLDGIVVRTPLLESSAINARFQGRILFKTEALQRTGWFKFRGAYNKISQLAQQGVKGVVAYSSGNHAQGVALAASMFDMRAVIVMPADSPAIKINNTKALGGEVVLYQRQHENREQIGAALAKEHQLALVKPYDDEDIIAGQGTIGIEATQQLQLLGLVPDTLIAPCGGGGLISGTAIAWHQAFPDTRILVAEPQGYDDAARSLQAAKRLGNTSTTPNICDAIVTPMVGELTFPIMQQHVGAGMAVSEHHVLKAMAMCMNDLKLVVEPGGCVGLAALLAGLVATKDKVTVVVLSGGNADPDILARALSA